jgi:hypothetical protein
MWGVVFLLLIVVVVIVVPLALVARGPTVRLISAEVQCPQPFSATYTPYMCVLGSIDSTGNPGVFIQVVVEVKSNSYSAGDAKFRADFYEPMTKQKLNKQQGDMDYRVKFKGYEKKRLTFLVNTTDTFRYDERIRFFDNFPQNVALIAAQVYNGPPTGTGSTPHVAFNVTIDGTVSSKFGPFAHTTLFRNLYTFPATS